MTDETLTPDQRLVADFTPKLAELTGEVLFGDVWERPGLSKRDRSLVTRGQPRHLQQPRTARRSPPPRQGQLPERGRAEESTHPPRLLRRLAQAMSAVQVAQQVFADN